MSRGLSYVRGMQHRGLEGRPSCSRGQWGTNMGLVLAEPPSCLVSVLGSPPPPRLWAGGSAWLCPHQGTVKWVPLWRGCRPHQEG